LGATLFRHKFLRRRTDLLRRAQVFFIRHGGKSIFFGRFVGPLRGFIPFVAGSARMPPLSFFLYTLVSALLWGLTYPGLGFLGGASWRQVQRWTGHFGVFMAILLFLFVLNGLFWKTLAPRLSAWVARCWQKQQSAWARLRQHPRMQALIERHPRTWRFLCARFSLKQGTGFYLTAGFAVSAVFAALLIWLIGDIDLLHRMDRQVYAALQVMRHPAADTLMLLLALLADTSILWLSVAFLLFWLILHNRDFSALILLVGLGGGELLLFILHLFFRRAPPASLAIDVPATLTEPSLAPYLFCGLAVYFLLGASAQRQSRLTLVIAGSFLAVLAGFSRIYLGLQWPSSVLAGLALTALWLTFLITASEMRRRYAGEFPWRVGWEPLHLRPRSRRLLLSAAAVLASAGIIWRLLVAMQGP
jgi:undecaprenyl-diphosphatase